MSQALTASVPSTGPDHPYNYAYPRGQFWHRWHHHATSRAVSMWTAAIADLLIVIYFGPMHAFSPNTVQGATDFGLTIFGLAIVYGVIQQWTLTKQTGTGEETAASLDKLFAISLAIVTVMSLVAWVVHAWTLGIRPSLSSEHYLIAICIIVYSLFDFMTTDVTNMRLRSLQLKSAPPGS